MRGMGLAGLTMTVLLLTGGQQERLDVRLVTDQAEAVLEVLNARASGREPSPEMWGRVFESEGYRRLRAREIAMGQPFGEEAFRAFVTSDSVLARAEQLRATLDGWVAADMVAAARRAFAYLPDDAVIRAKVYPVIKPKTNSFVFEPATDPAIFLYLDPDRTAARLENTVAHELHHIGYAGACPDPDPALPKGVRDARSWMSGFGEGLAVLAAAGGPDVHPHATSGPAERATWDRDVAHVVRDMDRLERFFLDLVAESMTEEEARARGFAFVVSDDVPQGAFYTVGWHMSATIERELGRDRLIATLCDPVQLLIDYNRAAKRDRSRRAELGQPEARAPVWSDSLVDRLRG